MTAVVVRQNSSPKDSSQETSTSKHQPKVELVNMITEDSSEIPSSYLAKETSSHRPLSDSPHEAQIECGLNSAKQEILNEAREWQIKLQTLQHDLLDSTWNGCKNSSAGKKLAQKIPTDINISEDCAPLRTYEKIRDHFKYAYFSNLTNLSRQDPCRIFVHHHHSRPQRSIASESSVGESEGLGRGVQ